MLSTAVISRCLAGGLAVAAMIAGCGGADEPVQADDARDALPSRPVEITIGNVVPLSGELSVFGPSGRKAADLAVETINQAAQEVGLRAPVLVRHADSQSTEAGAVRAARQMVDDRATCLLGAWASGNTLAVADRVAIRRQVPLLSPASTSASLSLLDDDGFLWRTVASDDLQARALAVAIAQELGGTAAKLSLAARDDVYGRGFVEQFRRSWVGMGGRVTGEPVLYEPGQDRYEDVAERIVAGEPDGFAIFDFESSWADVGRSLVRTEAFDSGRLFVSDALALRRIPEGIPDQALIGARGVRATTPSQGSTVSAFVDAYADAGGAGRQAFDAQSFDAAILCGLAALAAGSSEGVDIASRLRAVSSPPGPRFDFTQLSEAIEALQSGQDIDYEGVSGPVDFDVRGDPTAATFELFEYDEDGKLQVGRQILVRG